MATAVAPARSRPAPRAPREAPVAPRPQPRARARPRVTGGVVWILLVAVLLAGIVALNVAVLGLNMEIDRLDGEKERLRAEHAVLASELSTAAASGRIEAYATRRLGLVDPVQTTYIRLGGAGR